MSEASTALSQIRKDHWEQLINIYSTNATMLTEVELVLQCVFDLINYKPDSWKQVCKYLETNKLMKEID